MTLPRLLAGTLIILLLPQYASAQSMTCEEEMYQRLGQEQRLYRSVIFGMAKPEEMPTNTTLTDEEGDVWMKTAENEWRSTDQGNQDLTWSDATMEQQMDVPPRRGILEIRRALSSELVPSVLQALRATRCRMSAVCEVASQSSDAEADEDTLDVQPDGCIEFEMNVLDACRVRELTAFDQGICTTQAQSVIDREIKMLELIFAYDASYRTLMQFAGTFEGFLTDFRFPLLQPLWQMVRTLGQFDKLPCFLAECNE